MSNEKTNPEALDDTDLDQAAGGAKLGEDVNGTLKAKIATFHFDEDGKLNRKVLLASASGGGNVLGSGPAGGKTYTFDEEIDGDFVPVTYKLDG